MLLPHQLPHGEYLSLQVIANSGQIFRMHPVKHGDYSGVELMDEWTQEATLWSVVHEKSVVILGQQGSEIRFQTWPETGQVQMLEELFRCDVQIDMLEQDLSVDRYVEAAARRWKGLWLLRQHPWETLISFIISANKHFTHIQQCCDRLALEYGEKIVTPWGTFSAFPEPSVLAGLNEQELRDCKVGYRARFILDAARRLVLEPDFLRKVETMHNQAAVEHLTQITGVGDKIADCILLFAYARDDVVPYDVWLRRICVDLYGQSSQAPYELLRALHAEYFGVYAGWAQQWLFCHARNVHRRGVSLQETWFDEV